MSFEILQTLGRSAASSRFNVPKGCSSSAEVFVQHRVAALCDARGSHSQRVRISSQKIRYFILREWRQFCFCIAGIARLRLSETHLFSRPQDLLRTVAETVYFSEALATFLPPLKGPLDAGQHCLKRNTRLLPGLDQRPINRGEQQPWVRCRMRAAAAAKALLNFGKVVEIILHLPIAF